MIQNILGSIHTTFGKYLVSTILGIGFASIFRKSCQNKECLVFNGPHHEDITKSIYKHNDKCYTFESSSISCNTRKKQVQYA